MIEALAFALAGGLARLHDGGKLVPVPSNVIYFLLSGALVVFLNWSVPFGSWLFVANIIIALVAWGNLQMSYKTLQRLLRIEGKLGWHRWWNVLHFTPLGAFATVLGWVNGNFWLVCGYCAALLIIGALRPAFSKFAPQSHNWTRYVEFAEGAVVFGGLAAVDL